MVLTNTPNSLLHNTSCRPIYEKFVLKVNTDGSNLKSFSTIDIDIKEANSLKELFAKTACRMKDIFCFLEGLKSYELSDELIIQIRDTLKNKKYILETMISQLTLILTDLSSTMGDYKSEKSHFAFGYEDDTFAAHIDEFRGYFKDCEVELINLVDFFILKVEDRIKRKQQDLATALGNPDYSLSELDKIIVFNEEYMKHYLKMYLYHIIPAGFFDRTNTKLKLNLSTYINTLESKEKNKGNCIIHTLPYLSSVSSKSGNGLIQHAKNIIQNNIDQLVDQNTIHNIKGGNAKLLECIDSNINQYTNDVPSSSSIKIGSEFSTEKIEIVKQEIQTLRSSIVSLLSNFNTLMMSLSYKLNVIHELIEKNKNISEFHHHFYKQIIEGKQFINMTVFFTESEKKFFLIIIDEIIRSKIPQYTKYNHVFTIVRDYINKNINFETLVEENGDRPRDLVCGKQPKKYLKIFDPSTSLFNKEMICIYDLIMHLFVAEYIKNTSTSVVSFALINDFDKILNQNQIIFTKSDKKSENQLQYRDCCTINNTCPNGDTIFKKINFHYIFNTEDVDEIPDYIAVNSFLFEQEQDVLFITFGYSGVGKSVTLFGKSDVDPCKNVNGILIGFLKNLSSVEEFQIEVLEIYGKSLPITDNFENNKFKNNIAWIKSYTFIEEANVHVIDKTDFSKIEDMKEITDYFDKRFSDNHLSSLHTIKKEDAKEFIKNMTTMVIEPIEKIRMKNGTIAPTPNNKESSRSILMYTLIFTTKNRNKVKLTIIDFPGKEDPISTFVTSETRSTDEMTKYTNEIKLKYKDQPFDERSLIKLEDQFEKYKGIMNLLPFMPFLLFSLSYMFNRDIIDNINIKFPMYVPIIIEKLKKITLFTKSDGPVTFEKILNFQPNELQDVLTTNVINEEGLALISSRNHSLYLGEQKNRPNVLRLQYLYHIFFILFDLVGIPSTIDLFISTLLATDTPFYPDREPFFKVKEKKQALGLKLKNMFESYFINESIILILRDILIFKNEENRDKLGRTAVQTSEELKAKNMLPYILDRIASTDSSKLPITKDSDIYDLVEDNLSTDAEKLLIKTETDKLYDYSKMFSPITDNSLLQLFKIFNKTGGSNMNKKVRMYVIYTLSNVNTPSNCNGQVGLLASFADKLNELV